METTANETPGQTSSRFQPPRAESQKIAADYGIRSIPTLMLFKGGKVLDTLVGLVSKERLESFIKKAL